MTFLPESDRNYLMDKNIRYREAIDNGKKGIVLIDFELPKDKYNNDKVDLLILFPKGYSDIPPDMFYLYPGVKLKPNMQLAKATNVSIVFEQKKWQRWSRHFQKTDWRPGIDGIHTYLKKIETALRIAKVA